MKGLLVFCDRQNILGVRCGLFFSSGLARLWLARRRKYSRKPAVNVIPFSVGRHQVAVGASDDCHCAQAKVHSGAVALTSRLTPGQLVLRCFGQAN